jgi:hypothetical protein
MESPWRPSLIRLFILQGLGHIQVLIRGIGTDPKHRNPVHVFRKMVADFPHRIFSSRGPLRPKYQAESVYQQLRGITHL